jgi:hypothetical protein
MKVDAGAIGGAVGAAVGGYASSRWDNYLYAGIEAGAGFFLGEVIGWLYRNWIWRHRKKEGKNGNRF